jgi:hypothetical protein
VQCFHWGALFKWLQKESDNWTGGSWRRSPTSWGGGNSEAVKQTANALWLSYCTALGTELQTSIGLLLVELGMLFQLFLLSYANFGHMVTTSWLKGVWEKLDRIKFVVAVHNLQSMFPQDGDEWLMARFIGLGYGVKDLLILNRVRKH